MSEEALLPANGRQQHSAENDATAENDSAYSWYYENFAIAAGPLAGLLAYFIFLTDQDHVQQGSQKLAAMFAILLWICVWWMTEAVPIAITALLPLFLFPLLQISTADAVAKAYMNDTISLFLGSFILALAVQKYNCHKRLALKTLLVFGGEKMDPRTLLLGFCAGPAFVSMFMSNTAVAVMMIPMAVGVVQKVQNSPLDAPSDPSVEASRNPKHQKSPSDEESGYREIESGETSSQFANKALSKYSKGVVLAVGYAVGVGGMTTLTGTGPNLVFSGIFRSLFPKAEPVTYTQWLMFGFPLGVFFLLLLWFILCVMYCPTAAVPVVSASLSRSTIQKEYDSLGAMDSAEKTVVSLFTVLAFLWMTRATNGDVPGWGSYFHGYADDGTVSILMAMFLFILPFRGQKLMNWADCKKLPWDIVLVLGGGFALADGIRQSGLSEWIAAHLDFLHSIPFLLITPSVAVIVAIVTEFTSNNATATIFLPLLAEVSLNLNIHPLFLMVTATLASSFSFMLPIATPPNAVAYTAGKLRMTDLAIPGFLLKCTGIFLLSVLMPTLGNVVFNLDEKFQN
ncbi:hypothetical protein M758_7G088600 [Ceratodon purpureus]|nr:hypothetical protein M758_7G088600 [Ceratodon purpureus]KAG0610754.1 hypothetical protein M758_7G088600 [Ceratodon purpureus]KAG0610755.1 hypothetical protein M758_7G088600 [Ceratodon purpureus]